MSGRAILFDLDNTLHDRNRGIHGFLVFQHERRGFGVGVDEWIEAFVWLEQNGRVWKDVVYAQLCDRFRLAIDPETLLAEYEEEFARFVSPFPGHLSVIEKLRHDGWKTGLLTNGRTLFQRRTIDALGIEPLLDQILISEECGLRKPDPEIYRLALRELGCDASDSWFVGDDMVADVEGPRSIGMSAIHFGVDVDSLESVLPRLGP